ncbi:hypothetical protein GRJ2_001802900 [Grus japonensis]|uniref:Uncharacterized protein n=1 Tax=Grus japonensis TaxID=30415 RepID=A0ABC9X6R0_GRUJA
MRAAGSAGERESSLTIPRSQAAGCFGCSGSRGATVRPDGWRRGGEEEEVGASRDAEDEQDLRRASRPSAV